LVVFCFGITTTVACAGDSDPFITPEVLRDLQKAHKVKLVYFVPQDREPATNYAAKISVLMTFVADVYRRDLTSKGYASRGLDFEFEEGEPRVHLLRSTNVAAHYSGDPKFDSNRQWSRIVPELESAIGPAKDNLIVAFVETYSDGPAKWEWPGGFALGARYSAKGGVGMFSSWILRDEFCATNIAEQLKLFTNSTPTEGRIAHGHGKSNSPRFEFIEDGFGAVAHEMGHALGLPHDLRKEASYVMGNGFRHLRVNYLREFAGKPRIGFSPDDARFLAVTRFLGEDINVTDNTPPKAKLSFPDSVVRGATNLSLKIEATDNAALAGLLIFDKHRDSVVTGADLSGTNATRTFAVKVKTTGTNEAVSLRVIVSDRSGNQSTSRASILIQDAAR
jgi:hypothetical protein